MREVINMVYMTFAHILEHSLNLSSKFTGWNFTRGNKRIAFAWWKCLGEICNGGHYSIRQNRDIDDWQTCCDKGGDTEMYK